MQKKLNQENKKKSININFDDVSLVPQLIGVNNKNLREIEEMINVELDSNGSLINLYGNQKDCILAKEIITLPMYPNLNKREIHKVLKNIENWYKENVKKK